MSFQNKVTDVLMTMPMYPEFSVGFVYGIPRTLEFEGKLSDHPADPGGVTKWGISIVYLTESGGIDPEDGYLLGDQDRDGRITRADILALPMDEAIKIYWLQWWQHYDYDRLADPFVKWKIFDMAVNMGSVRAHMIAQTAAGGLQVDGILGPKSVARINTLWSEGYLRKLRDGQERFYLRIVEKKPDKEVFLRGWLRRAAA